MNLDSCCSSTSTTTDTACECDSGILERPRYFPRQLITPDDLTLEQDYFRDKFRLHNRMLHGWGVVCGAIVSRVPSESEIGEDDPWKVRVSAGYILGPYGHEIAISCEHEIDVRGDGVIGACGEPAELSSDPWCSEVTVKPSEDGTVCIAIKYKEVETRPVRVQPVGCGCDETQCEYSRLRDCYQIGILEDCPPDHQNPPAFPWNEPPSALIACPPCPTSPWVGLALITYSANDGITAIDNCGCRRMVMAAHSHWWRCVEKRLPREQEIEIESGEDLRAGMDAKLALLLPGRRWLPDYMIELVDPETAKIERFESKVENHRDIGKFRVSLTIPEGTKAGERHLRVVRNDRVIATSRETLEILPKQVITERAAKRTTKRVVKKKVTQKKATKKRPTQKKAAKKKATKKRAAKKKTAKRSRKKPQ